MHIEPHALRYQRQLLVFQHLFDQWPNPELGRIEANAIALPGAEGQQVFNHALQLNAVLLQNGSDFPLTGAKLADRTVHQQFGAFADISQRRLEFVRHMPQESVAFLGQV